RRPRATPSGSGPLVFSARCPFARGSDPKPSERVANRKHRAVIVGMKTRGRDLHARGGGKLQGPPQAYPAEPQSRRQEHLRLPRILALQKECGIDFELGPKSPKRAILEGRVRNQLPPDRGYVPGRQVASERR